MLPLAWCKFECERERATETSKCVLSKWIQSWNEGKKLNKIIYKSEIKHSRKIENHESCWLLGWHWFPQKLAYNSFFYFSFSFFFVLFSNYYYFFFNIYFVIYYTFYSLLELCSHFLLFCIWLQLFI